MIAFDQVHVKDRGVTAPAGRRLRVSILLVAGLFALLLLDTSRAEAQSGLVTIGNDWVQPAWQDRSVLDLVGTEEGRNPFPLSRRSVAAADHLEHRLPRRALTRSG